MEETINKRVMTYIKEKSMTIKGLAAEIGVNEKTLGNKLTGRIRIDMDTALALLSKFDRLSAEWLMRGTGPMELGNESSDEELRNVCIDQAREILRLKLRIVELEAADTEKKNA